MKYLNELANIYWPRPENALWLTKVMQLLDDVEFEEPILDLMCGHGIWSFIRAGGAFGYGFDGYQDVKNLEKYQDGEDIQNAFSEQYKPEITRKPGYRIACGLDWKENNLKKCETLDFYDKLVQANCNEKLPFNDGEFQTIFSNTIYWVDNLEHILSEVKRILKPGGKAVLINYLPPINDYLEIYRGRVSNEWLKLIDRNRSNENKHIYSKAKWEELYNKAGLKTSQYIPTANGLFAHIWNIGLRPFAGFIMQMAAKLSKEEMDSMKEEWVKTLVTIAEPFISNPEFSGCKDGKEAEAIFVLEKK